MIPFRLAAFTALLSAALLGGCASMTSVAPGTPLAQVESEFGRHNYSCPLPDGGQRVIWSRQPFGQFAWGANVDSQGRVGEVTQLLTDQNFAKLGQGTWTDEQVLCEFGPPAEIDGVGLPSVRQIVWSYRYLQNGVWNSLMYVYMGPAQTPASTRTASCPFFKGRAKHIGSGSGKTSRAGLFVLAYADGMRGFGSRHRVGQAFMTHAIQLPGPAPTPQHDAPA